MPKLHTCLLHTTQSPVHIPGLQVGSLKQSSMKPASVLYSEARPALVPRWVYMHGNPLHAFFWAALTPPSNACRDLQTYETRIFIWGCTFFVAPTEVYKNTWQWQEYLSKVARSLSKVMHRPANSLNSSHFCPKRKSQTGMILLWQKGQIVP